MSSGIFSLTEQPFGLLRSCIKRYFPGSLLGIAYRGEYVAFSTGGDEYGPKIRPRRSSVFIFSIITDLFRDFFTFKSALLTGTFGAFQIPIQKPRLKPDAMYSRLGFPTKQSHKRLALTGVEMLAPATSLALLKNSKKQRNSVNANSNKFFMMTSFVFMKRGVIRTVPALIFSLLFFFIQCLST